MDKITCVVLNYNDAETTIKMIDKISSYRVINYFLIVDNKSTDNSFNILKNRYENNKKVIVIETNRNGGYGYGNNIGVEYANKKLKSEFVIISNPDVFFTEKTIETLLKIIKNTDSAIVSAVQKIKNIPIKDKAWKIPTSLEWTLSETVLFRKWAIPRYHYNNNYFKKKIVMVDCVPGAMFIVDSQKFLNVNGYDEEMFLFGEETVLAYKFKQKGYKTLLMTDESYDHLHSVSINKNIRSQIRQLKILHKSKLLFYKKYLKCNNFKIIIYKFIFSLIILKKRVKGFR